MTTCTTPCATCPWRKSSTIGGADIPNFDIELMRKLSNTVGRGDAFRPIMACHGSTEESSRICIGYAHVEGYSNLNCRIEAMNGRLNMPEIDKACAEIDLWDSFDEMLDAYEEAQ